MRESKLVVGLREVFRTELLIVRLTCAFDISSAPAWIDQLPCPIVDLDSVPGVATRILRRNRSTCFIAKTCKVLKNHSWSLKSSHECYLPFPCPPTTTLSNPAAVANAVNNAAYPSQTANPVAKVLFGVEGLILSLKNATTSYSML
jgi:hypothetical protein